MTDLGKKREKFDVAKKLTSKYLRSSPKTRKVLDPIVKGIVKTHKAVISESTKAKGKAWVSGQKARISKALNPSRTSPKRRRRRKH